MRQDRDPHLAREAAKYEKPIPSREFIIAHLEKKREPLTFDQLLLDLDIKDDDERVGLKRRLRAMEREGQIVYTRREQYGLASKMELVRGRVVAKKEGEGFVIPEDNSPVLHIAARQMRDLFSGDQVLVRISGFSPKKEREGVIVDVLSRAHTVVVGHLHEGNAVYIVVPFNKRIFKEIFVLPADIGTAKPGDIVEVTLSLETNRFQEVMGKVTKVISDGFKEGQEIDMAMAVHHIPHVWPDEIEADAAQISHKISPAEIKRREDLRDLPFVTIDGEDARDFDDAVCVEQSKSGAWVLWVAIADVSHYVKPKSALDREAEARGNSVYFPRRVIPMLPEVLSNDLCSLNPNVPRLALVVKINISKDGKISRSQFMEAVFVSQARLTYTEVAAYFKKEKDNRIQNTLAAIHAPLQNLYAVYQLLLSKRGDRGAIDFETQETRMLFNEAGQIQKIIPVVRNEAHRLIEECMLAANVSAAKLLIQHKSEVEGIFRIHDTPVQEKLVELRQFLAEFGLKLSGGQNPEPKDYSKLLQSVAHRADKKLIQTVLLRSLSQAVYSPKNVGHFGLAYPAYTHFTSPIRRYSDLLVHRAIKAIINEKTAKVGKPFNDAHAMQSISDHVSMTERRADDATRDATAWLKCQYISHHEGSEFDGIISSVTHFGIFVELTDVYVDGLVHITALGEDYYHFDAARHRLMGERTQQIFRLGDPVRVRVEHVEVEARKIDFSLVSSNQPKLKKKGKTAETRHKKDSAKTEKSKGKRKRKPR